MQILSAFIGSVQEYSPYDSQIESQRPVACPVCPFLRPAGKGTYMRQVWLPHREWIAVRRFVCRRPGCGCTISLSRGRMGRRIADRVAEMKGITPVVVLDEAQSLPHAWCSETPRRSSHDPRTIPARPARLRRFRGRPLHHRPHAPRAAGRPHPRPPPPPPSTEIQPPKKPMASTDRNLRRGRAVASLSPGDPTRI